MVDPVMTTPFARGLHVEKYNDICKMTVMADKPKPNPATYLYKNQALIFEHKQLIQEGTTFLLLPDARFFDFFALFLFFVHTLSLPCFNTLV